MKSALNDRMILAELVAVFAGVRASQQREEALVIEASKQLESVAARGSLDKQAVELLGTLVNLHKVRENLSARVFSSPSFLIVEEGLHRVNTLVEAGHDVDQAMGQVLVDMDLGDPGEGLDLADAAELSGFPPLFKSEHLPGGDGEVQIEPTLVT